MRKKVFLIVLILFLSTMADGIKICQLPQTSGGTTSDYLVKEDASCVDGTKKITVADFISHYGLSGGGGGGSSSTYNETPTGSINGINPVFTTSSNYLTGTTRVYKNGIRQKPGGGNDYTETAANQITMTSAPVTGDQILIDFDT